MHASWVLSVSVLLTSLGMQTNCQQCGPREHFLKFSHVEDFSPPKNSKFFLSCDEVGEEFLSFELFNPECFKNPPKIENFIRLMMRLMLVKKIEWL